MRRGAKPAKAKGESKRPVARKSGKGEGSRVGDLEKRLAEALKREAAALENQTATSEILRVISSSPTDLQPVFDTIVRNAARVCEAFDAVVVLADGEEFGQRAHHGPIAAVLGARYPLRGTVNGRAILEARVIHVENLAEASDYSVGRELAQQVGYRTMLSVPLLRDGAAIGAIGIRRTEVLPFSDEQIALLKTFADQAVIAIENVRLFKELEARNSDLTEALEQQTATAEVLRVISRSPTDIRPVVESVAERAARLCEANDALIFQTDGDVLRRAAAFGTLPPGRTVIPLTRRSVVGRVAVDRQILHLTDIGPEFLSEFPESMFVSIGVRTALGVPLLRQGVSIGIILIRKLDPRQFTDKQIALLQTFADQAVIAIENVRLFKELEAANRELAAASQHKSEFLANMSHELRTPLNAVIGFSEVLSERMFGDLNAKQEEYLKDIHASGQHLLSLINDILDLSKIEAGRMELELADFDLPTAIDNALTLVRERAGRRGITLGCEIDERVGMIQGDERKVKQVLLNILSNALKFTPGGRIDVRAALKEGTVEISVTDTGVGIAPEDQEAIFEEFRQVGTSDKKVEGTGLGLALSRKFVELHGGRIWVKSQLGQGSTFTFTIPVRSEP
jgi:signal transduction histidine kinase